MNYAVADWEPGLTKAGKGRDDKSVGEHLGGTDTKRSGLTRTKFHPEGGEAGRIRVALSGEVMTKEKT